MLIIIIVKLKNIVEPDCKYSRLNVTNQCLACLTTKGQGTVVHLRVDTSNNDFFLVLKKTKEYNIA